MADAEYVQELRGEGEGGKRAGQIITFYSYKGGTGRSMVLANVGYLLASEPLYSGKKVLMIDWDLEAPGLHKYFSKDFAGRFGSPKDTRRYAQAFGNAPGLIDFLALALEIYRTAEPAGGLPESEAHTARATGLFQQVLEAASFAKLPLNVDGIPGLCLLKSGREDASYSDRVRRFDWDHFYSNYGSFFTNLRTYLMREYDYVLIDSRTGLTDSSGICTRVMPEKLVAVFVPNRQNIDGLKEVIRRAKVLRGDSRDARGLVAFPLASRIDGSNSTLRTTWWQGGRLGDEQIEGYQKEFEQLFMELYDLDEGEISLSDYFNATQVPHDTDYAYGEKIAARSRSGTSDKLSIRDACANLTKWLVTLPAPWESPPDPALEARRLAEASARRALEAAREREKLAFRLRLGVIAAAVALVILGAGVLWLYYPSAVRVGQAVDEARLAGSKASSFVAADEDYFHQMDSGTSLTADEIRGRNTWMVWSAGNDRFWDTISASFPEFDLLKVISSQPNLRFSRDRRWEYFGLVNEPCFTKATSPDKQRFGLWLDQRSPACATDPFENEQKYPGVALGARGKNLPLGSYYGYPTGVVGLRLFPNPDFDETAANRWDANRYYTDPAYYESKGLIRPYRVGMTCGFCHAGPNPTNPPADPDNPKWENLSSIAGGQHLWMDRLATWDYDTSSYLFQVLHTFRPGTLNPSLVAADNINDGRAVTPIYYLGPRLTMALRWGKETLAGVGLNNKQLNDFTFSASGLSPRVTMSSRGTNPGPPSLSGFFQAPDTVWTPRFLKDGAGSIGVLGGLNGFYLKMGVFSEEWLQHVNPLLGGKRMTPVQISTLRQNSIYWQATEAQTPNVVRFLLHVSEPHRLADAPGGTAYLGNSSKATERGKVVFAERCARCHSSKLPAGPGLDPSGCAGRDYLNCWNTYWQASKTEDFKQKMRQIVLTPDFLTDNYLSNDARVPVTLLGTNACSSLAGDAVEGNIWDGFSSQSYKDLPSVGTITVYNPFTGAPLQYKMPAGGRGYTRVPSLVSLWSTAPFLLNNSVGKFEANPLVPERMLAFQDSIEKLLWPERRDKDAVLADKIPGVIDRTTTASYLRIPGRYLPDSLRGLLDLRHRFFVKLFGEGWVEIGPIPAGTPVNLLANLALLPQSTDPAERASHGAEVLTFLARLSQDLKNLPKGASNEEALNVLANLAQTALNLSACPDLVVNRGHYFGTSLFTEEPGLSDEDKRALIEFLKRF